MAWRGRPWRGEARPGEARASPARQEDIDVNAFQPIGAQARWRVIYGILCKTPTNGTVTYETLGEALGLDPDGDRHAIQMAMRRAAAEHEAEDKRAVDVVPNEGYRVVPAPEHLDLARRHQKKAGRSLVRGQSKVVNVDLSDIEDPEVRKALELTAQAFSLQLDFNRRFAVRQSQLEKTVHEIAGTQSADRKRTDEEVARLRERVELLEREREEK
jgi:hypothetical protein